MGVNGTIPSYNLFAYCENNPCNMADSLGTDAYWITDSTSLLYLGHSSLLIDINGSWYYFYFGAQDFFNPVNGPSNVVFEKVGINFLKNGKINFSSLNKRLTGQDGNKTFKGSKKYKGTYNMSVYINTLCLVCGVL